MRSILVIIAILFFCSAGFAQPPLSNDQFYFDQVCNLTQERMIDVSIIDPEGDQLSYSLIVGVGSIDAVTGVLSYTPDTSGVFYFEVSANDGSNETIYMVWDTLILNSPPKVFCNDSVVNLCAPEEICFDVIADDPDLDFAYIFKLEGVGSFEQLDGSSGRVCFMPADLDSADYLFIFRAADDCIINGSRLSSGNFPPCCRDTSLITVLINRPPTISCPDDIVLINPTEDEYCFDIESANPDGSDIAYNILSGNANLNNNQVCFNINETKQFVIEIEATNECGRSDTCQVSVTIDIEDEGDIYFDIKPTSCPNPLNIKGNVLRGGSMLPTAILGTEEFDVRDIDPSSLYLMGIAPIRWSYEDETAPALKSEDSCVCTEEGPDGYEDMTLKFDKEEIMGQLGGLYDGQIIELTISGKLNDGTEFEASDCMLVRAGKSGQASEVDSNMKIKKPHLVGNNPNPFNPSTVISFRLTETKDVKLEIINLSGQIVSTLANRRYNAGLHLVTWDAGSFASGIYFYRLTTDDNIDTKKMVLLK